jgi:hypothetical protein
MTPIVAMLTSPGHPESKWSLPETRYFTLLAHALNHKLYHAFEVLILSQLAVSFGPSTTDGVLVAYRYV